MKNKWTPFIVFTLFLLIVLGAIACRSTPPIVGYWQDVEQKNQYLEFSKDGRVIFDDGKNIITGTYELIGDNYIKVKFEGLGGAFFSLFGADTWKYQIAGDTMTLQVGGESATLKRVR